MLKHCRPDILTRGHLSLLHRLHYWYSSFQYDANVRNKWELFEILLLSGGAPFLLWSTLCCLEVPFSSRTTLGRMKYPKYHERYPKGTYWYPIGTLISIYIVALLYAGAYLMCGDPWLVNILLNCMLINKYSTDSWLCHLCLKLHHLEL